MSKYTEPSHMLELKRMFQQIWDDKLLIIGGTGVVAIIAVLVTLSMPNVYRSEAVISPAESFASEIPQAGGLSSLASIAGLRLGQSNSQVELALEYLRSRVFLARFLEKYPGAQVELMAVDEWDKVTNTILYDEDIYDPDTQQWLREPQPMRPAAPTLTEMHEAFLKQLSIEQDRISPFIRLSFTHVSPYVAQRWVRALITEVNATLQSKSLAQSQQSIAYLEAQLVATQVVSIKQSLFTLIQNQMEKQMLAQTSPEYVFQIIDPPYVADQKDSPRRALIVFLCMVLGGTLMTILTIIRHHFK